MVRQKRSFTAGESATACNSASRCATGRPGATLPRKEPVTGAPNVSTHIRRLVEHLAWADARTLESLRMMPASPLDALRLFGHVLAAEQVWLSRIDGRAPNVPIWPSMEIDECAALAARNQAGFAKHAAAAPDALAREVRYRNTKGEEYVNTVEDILLHVALHGSYHRGQVAKIVRGEGGVPQPTDYIVFLRSPAAPR
jgi:uncharacterized damage-inducible protein DinB